jgi:hypothetical protein
MSLPRDPDHDLERLLADDGGDLAALYRRLPKAEPPRRLDRSVLGEAARAVRGHTPRRQRWLLGVGSAAGIVLAAGIAWHVGQDALRREAQGEWPVQGAPATPSRNQNYVPVHPLDEPAPKRAPPPAQDTVDAAAPAAAAPPPPAAARPAPRKAEARAKEHAPPLAQPLAPAPPPPAPAAMAAPAPQAAPAEAERAEGKSGEGFAAGITAGAADATKAKVAPAGHGTRSRAVSAPPSSSVELRRDMQLAPDDWLAHIRQLLHQGRRQQAIESLRLFQATHPDHPLPAELRALLD